MTRNIEIIIHDGEALANFEGREINLGKPTEITTSLFSEQKFKLSNDDEGRLKIVYSEDIPEHLERNLHDLSICLGMDGQILSDDPLYKPNKRNKYSINLPKGVTTIICYNPKP